MSRRRKLCPKGHAVVGDNICYSRSKGRTYEKCRICRNASANAANKKRRAWSNGRPKPERNWGRKRVVIRQAEIPLAQQARLAVKWAFARIDR